MQSDRRSFLFASSAGALGLFSLAGQPARRILIRAAGDRDTHQALAERELLRGLALLRIRNEARIAGPEERPAASDLLLELRVEPKPAPGDEAYSIRAAGANQVVITGASGRALLYAVFEFLERQGAFFGIDGESYPLDVPAALALPRPGESWDAKPRFAVRGLLPWPDFLNCITVYNQEDFRAYFEAMLRMRFNTFGMHVYTTANQWAESYLSFEYAGAGHLAHLDTTAGNRWSYLPQRTSRYGMGAGQLYDSEVFGSDATRLGRDPWEIAEKTRALLAGSLAYANRLGLRTGVGFEPYQIPDEIYRALPPEVQFPPDPKKPHSGARFDIDSVNARRMLETRLAQLLEAYPGVDTVWLWEDEGMNWDSRNSNQALSVTPFLQAHDFLKRHAPKKRLVIGGWGGVVRNFPEFHRRLPGYIVFTCLSDTLGWDPINEVFGKLEGRERWPIPWLEDDPGMWLTQLHVHRFQKDLDLAESYGCQGMMGIHWRHRIVDPTASYQARYSWSKELTPEAHYASYARTQAAGPRAASLAATLTAADRDGTLLSTFTGEFKKGHAEIRAYSGDYSEAFTFWNDYEPAPAVVASQREVADALAALVGKASTPLEKERLGYLAGHVEFLVPYAEAWTLAHRIHLVLKQAADFKKKDQAAEARAVVQDQAVPLWLKLAPEVRRAMLAFQHIVATRNDLGTLASKQNKFVRLALVRLRLSMIEYLGELPDEVESAYALAIAPEAAVPARLFAPTRPTMLAPGERVRVMVVAPGAAPVRGVTLHTRPKGAAAWTVTPARLMGRRTYEAMLGPFPKGSGLIEYYFSADIGAAPVTAPPRGGPASYLLTLLA